MRQHYHDFLNREPDAAGLAFWKGQMTSCGNPNLEVCRVNVSAAFFQSIEFQQTGYMIYLLEKGSYGDMPRYRAFVRDTQEIGKGVVVGAPGWQDQLTANKNAFVDEWVNTAAFKGKYDSMSDAQFVNTLFSNAGIAAQRISSTTLTMGFCLDCHRNPGPNLRPVAEVTNMNWAPPAEADPVALGETLVEQNHVHTRTSCTTCHR